MTTRLTSLLVLLLPWVAFAANALNFDNTDDYVQTPLSAGQIGSTFTIEAWVNASSISDNPIVSTLTTAGNTGMELHLQAGGSLCLTVRSSITGWNDFNTPSDWISANSWTHVAATFNGTTATLYVNGQPSSATGTILGSFVAGAELLEIGRRASGDPKYAGDISDVQIWNVVRSQTEIQADMLGYATAQTNQLAYYKMDQGTAGGDNSGITAVTDLVDPANNGTLHNFALSGASSNWVSRRAVSQAAVMPSGTGSSASPYLIDSLPNLLWLSTNKGAWSTGNEFRLMKNIDASDTKNWNSGSGFSPIGDNAFSFDGFFHGNGKVITGLTIHRPDSDSLGFFGRVGATGTVDSLGLQSASVQGRTTMGALFGINRGTVTQSFVASSAVTSAAPADLSIGLLGGWNIGTISNSYARGTVSVTGLLSGNDVAAGGMVANNSGTISKCYTMGSVTASSIDDNADAGGIAASNSGVISHCFSMDTLTATVTNSFVIMGGITAYNSGKVINSYAAGPNHTNGRPCVIGGIAGIAEPQSAIDGSYAVGQIIANGCEDEEDQYIGGLVGWAQGGTFKASYWDTQTTGQTIGLGVIGGNLAKPSGGLSTAAMMTATSFGNLDLANVWVLYEGHTYPLLRDFMTPLTVTAQTAVSKHYDKIVPNGDLVTYSLPSIDASLLQGSRGAAETATALGTYTIDPSQLYSSQLGYLITPVGSGILTIDAAPLTITGAIANNKIYDGTTTATISGASLSGKIAGDDIVMIPGTASFATKDAGLAKTVIASGYSIGGADAGNYTLSAQPTGLTADITRYPITVTADAKSIKKGEANVTLTYTATDLFGSDVFTGALTRKAGDTAGTYAILQGTLSAGSNYNITFKGANYVIAPGPVSNNPTLPRLAFTGRASAGIFNLQGQQVWAGMLDVEDGRFVMPNVGAGKWVVKMRLENAEQIINQVVR